MMSRIRILPRIRILLGLFACYFRIARIRWEIKGEIKSRRWAKLFYYSTAFMFSWVVVAISVILSIVPKPSSLSQEIAQYGLTLLLAYALFFSILTTKMISKTDVGVWRLEGDLRFKLVSEKLNLKRLKEAW